MRRTTILYAPLLAAVVAGPIFAIRSEAIEQAPSGSFVDPTQYEGKEVIVVFGIGEGQNRSKQPNAFDITVPLVSSTTGKVIGNVRHEPKCADDAPPCVVLKDQDTYDIGDGTIVTNGRVSFVPDPDRPGFNLTKGQPLENNIISATGAYAGRTGKVRVYGYVDARKFPASFILDEVYVIALDR